MRTPRPAEHAFATHHYSAGTPAERAGDLMAAFADPDVAAVVLSMGGATAIDVLDLLDYDTIAANPKILTGISDSTTVLQAVTARTGLVTFHGIELYDYSRDPMPYTTANALNVWRDGWHGTWPENPAWHELSGETTTYTHRRTIREGTAIGPLIGGNSEAVTQLIGTPYEPDVDGTILGTGDLPAAQAAHPRPARLPAPAWLAPPRLGSGPGLPPRLGGRSPRRRPRPRRPRHRGHRRRARPTRRADRRDRPPSRESRPAPGRHRTP